MSKGLPRQEVEELKSEAQELLDQVAKLETKDRRVVLAAIRGMMLVLEK